MPVLESALRPKTHVDYPLSFVAVLLSAVGLLAIASASAVVSLDRFDTTTYYLTRQAVALVIGLIALAVCSQIDYRVWRRLAPTAFLATVILLILVLTPLGTTIGGARRWLDLGPVLFQPSELAKLTFIIYLAAWFEKREHNLSDWRGGFLPFLVVTAFVGGLIIIQPDMGTMMVLALTAMIVAFVAGAKSIHLIYAGVFAAVATIGLIVIEPYRFKRLLTFFNPSDLQGAAYHINQSLLAIGSGGLLGKGFGQSAQKHLYLPAPHTDSIFAIVAEELGFVRAGLIIGLFVWLAWRGFSIARAAPDTFSRLLSAGITSWLVVQSVINLGAMLNIIPLTGVPLPFISYGGSSLVITLAAVGILLSISRQAKGRV